LPEDYDILIPGNGRTCEGFAQYLAGVEAARPAVNGSVASFLVEWENGFSLFLPES